MFAPKSFRHIARTMGGSSAKVHLPTRRLIWVPKSQSSSVGLRNRRPMGSTPRGISVSQDLGGSSEEVDKQVVAVGGENRLGMKLHALNVKFAVAKSHDETVFAGRSDLQLGGDGVSVDD